MNEQTNKEDNVEFVGVVEHLKKKKILMIMSVNEPFKNVGSS